MTNKSVKRQLLLERKAANRGRRMIRKVTKTSVKRTEVYKVWSAYLDIFCEELLSGREVKGMANVGTFVVEKKRVSQKVLNLRAKGLMAKKGKVMPIRKINLNNLDYVFKINFRGGRNLVEGVKFYSCASIRKKVTESIIRGKDYRNVN